MENADRCAINIGSEFESMRDSVIDSIDKIERVASALLFGGCTIVDRPGDCKHAVGLPGISVPGQHDGPDDTVDMYGKPNGWCWSCWKSHQIEVLSRRVRELEEWQDKCCS